MVPAIVMSLNESEPKIMKKIIKVTIVASFYMVLVSTEPAAAVELFATSYQKLDGDDSLAIALYDERCVTRTVTKGLWRAFASEIRFAQGGATIEGFGCWTSTTSLPTQYILCNMNKWGLMNASTKDCDWYPASQFKRAAK